MRLSFENVDFVSRSYLAKRELFLERLYYYIIVQKAYEL